MSGPLKKSSGMYGVEQRKADRRKRAAVGQPCPFCSHTMRPWTVSFDHDPPRAEMVRAAEEARRAGNHRQMRACLRKMKKAHGRVCCRRCNNRRGTMSFDLFRAWLATPPGREFVGNTS